MNRRRIAADPPDAGGGATPMLPKNGRSGMTIPARTSAVIVFAVERDDRVPAPCSQFARRKPLQPL